ncbi:MAG: cache domain-containing protein [Alphaproteobacteria bacterium]|nr:cache domain-containing protein [Alphaproteobacteria bacterium]
MSADPTVSPWWSRFSISRWLQVFAVFAVMLIVAGTTHRLLASRALMISETEQQMSRLDMVFAEQTGRAVETIDLILLSAIRTLQEESAPPSAATANLQQRLARRIAGLRQVSEIAIADAHGVVLYSSRGGAPNPLAPAARALIAAQAASSHPNPGLQFSKPFRDHSGKWTALMLRPILGSDGKYEGAALAFLNLSYFEDFYRAVELSEAGAILLFLRDGTVLARYPQTMSLSGRAMPICRHSRRSWHTAWPALSLWTAR